MTSKLLTQWNFSPFDFAVAHFEKVFEQFSYIRENKEEEYSVLFNFFKEFNQIEDDYKQKIIELCTKYQTKVYETFNDEKIQQHFQILINNLFQKTESLIKSQDYLKNFEENLNLINSELKTNLSNKIQFLDHEKLKFSEMLSNMKKSYSQYLKDSDNMNDICFKKIDDVHDNIYKFNELLTEMKSANKFDDKIKIIEKVSSFNFDVGKKSAKEIRDFIRDQRSQSSGSLSQYVITKFNSKYESLRVNVHSKVKENIKKMNKKEESLISSTEKEIKEITKKTELEFKDLSFCLLNYLEKQEKIIQICSEEEINWKEKIKSHLVKFMCNFFPHNENEILRKNKNIVKNIQRFVSKFKNLLKVLLKFRII